MAMARTRSRFSRLMSPALPMPARVGSAIGRAALRGIFGKEFTKVATALATAVLHPKPPRPSRSVQRSAEPASPGFRESALGGRAQVQMIQLLAGTPPARGLPRAAVP